MSKFRSLFLGKRLTLIFFLISGFLLSVFSACFAQNRGDRTFVSGTVTIQSKGNGGIVIDRQQYNVSKSTAILDVDGTRISLCDLPIPCEAVIEYQLIENQEPVCLKIETKRVLEAASSFVIEDDPG